MWQGSKAAFSRSPMPLERLREIARHKLVAPSTHSKSSSNVSVSASEWAAAHNTHLDGLGSFQQQRRGRGGTGERSLAMDLSLREDEEEEEEEEEEVVVEQPVQRQNSDRNGGPEAKAPRSSMQEQQKRVPARRRGGKQAAPAAAAAVAGRKRGQDRKGKKGAPTLEEILEKGAHHFLGAQAFGEGGRVPQSEQELMEALGLGDGEGSWEGVSLQEERRSRAATSARGGSRSPSVAGSARSSRATSRRSSVDQHAPAASRKMTMAQRARIRATLEKHKFDEDTVQGQLDKLDQQLKMTREKWQRLREDGSVSPGGGGGRRNESLSLVVTPGHSPRSARKSTPRGSRRNSRSGSPRSSPVASRRGSLQGSPVASRRGSLQGSPVASRRGSLQPAVSSGGKRVRAAAPSRRTPVASRSTSAPGSRRGSRPASPRRSPVASRRPSPSGSRRNSRPVSPRGGGQGRSVSAMSGGGVRRAASRSLQVSPRGAGARGSRGVVSSPVSPRRSGRRHSLDMGSGAGGRAAGSMRVSVDLQRQEQARRRGQQLRPAGGSGTFTPPQEEEEEGEEAVMATAQGAQRGAGHRRVRSGTITKSMLQEEIGGNSAQQQQQQQQTRLSDEELKRALQLTGIPRSSSVPVRQRRTPTKPKGVPLHTASRAAAKREQQRKREQQVEEQRKRMEQQRQGKHAGGGKQVARSQSAPRARTGVSSPPSGVQLSPLSLSTRAKVVRGSGKRAQSASRGSKRSEQPTHTGKRDLSSSAVTVHSVVATPEKRQKVSRTPEGQGRKFRRRRFTNLATLGGNAKVRSPAAPLDDKLEPVPWSSSQLGSPFGAAPKGLPSQSSRGPVDNPYQPWASAGGRQYAGGSPVEPAHAKVALPHLLIHSEEIQRVLQDMERTEKAIQFEKYELEKRRLQQSQLQSSAYALEPALSFGNPAPRSRALQEAQHTMSSHFQDSQHSDASLRLSVGVEELHASHASPANPPVNKLSEENQENAVLTLLRVEQQSVLLQKNLKLQQRILDSYRSRRANTIARRMHNQQQQHQQHQQQQHQQQSHLVPAASPVGRGGRGSAWKVEEGSSGRPSTSEMVDLIAKMPVADVAASLRELQEMTLQFSGGPRNSSGVQPQRMQGESQPFRQLEAKLEEACLQLEHLQTHASLLKGRIAGHEETLDRSKRELSNTETRELQFLREKEQLHESRTGAAGEASSARDQLTKLLETPLPSEGRPQFVPQTSPPSSSSGQGAAPRAEEDRGRTQREEEEKGEEDEGRRLRERLRELKELQMEEEQQKQRQLQQQQLSAERRPQQHQQQQNLKEEDMEAPPPPAAMEDSFRQRQQQQQHEGKQQQEQQPRQSADPRREEVHSSAGSNPNEEGKDGGHGRASALGAAPAPAGAAAGSGARAAGAVPTRESRFQDFHLPGSPSQFAATEQERLLLVQQQHQEQKPGESKEGDATPTDAALARAQRLIERLHSENQTRTEEELVSKMLGASDDTQQEESRRQAPKRDEGRDSGHDDSILSDISELSSDEDDAAAGAASPSPSGKDKGGRTPQGTAAPSKGSESGKASSPSASQRAQDVRRSIRERCEEVQRQREQSQRGRESQDSGSPAQGMTPDVAGRFKVVSRLQNAMQQGQRQQQGQQHPGEGSVARAPPSAMSLSSRSAFYQQQEQEQLQQQQQQPAGSGQGEGDVARAVMAQHFGGATRQDDGAVEAPPAFSVDSWMSRNR